MRSGASSAAIVLLSAALLAGARARAEEIWTEGTWTEAERTEAERTEEERTEETRTEEAPLLPGLAHDGPAPPAEIDTADVIARLDRIESRLDSLEDKLDRLDELLRLLFASRLRRVELLARNESLGRAIVALEERYSIRNIAEALTEDDIEKLVTLRRSLAGAAARVGARKFASDPDAVTVLAAMAGRRDFLVPHGRTFLTGLAGRDMEALAVLVLALLERREPDEPDSPGAKEAALWAAPRARGALLGTRLSEFAGEADEGKPRLYALAQAAAAAHGDGDAAKRLTRAVREGTVAGAFAHQLAGELAAAGSTAAFAIYLELLRDERYAFAAGQAFNRINGFERRIGWREVREKREEVYEEFKTWLEQNREKLRYDEAKRRFTVE